MAGRDELKKFCRVCGVRVSKLYKRQGGRRCTVCLHRTHREHMARNNRVCSRCSKEDLAVFEDSKLPDGVSLVHLTDIHFGEVGCLERMDLVMKWIKNRGMNFVLISGDLTAKAVKEEYQMAARWINDVEVAGIKVAVVPGNHDIGYWGSYKSVGRQLIGRKYHWWIEIIDRPIEPVFKGPGCTIIGLNSAHGINPSRSFNGYLNRDQRIRAGEVLRATPPDFLKVVFCHHPFMRFEKNIHRAMFNADTVREELAAAGCDLFLWGHQHSFAAIHIETSQGKSYAIQSPTLSERTRNMNYPGFAVIEWFYNDHLTIRSLSIKNSDIIEGEKAEFYLKNKESTSRVGGRDVVVVE